MHHLSFGTDGIRTRVGAEPLTQQSVLKLGNAIALWAQQKYGNSPHILLAHDTRNSCAWLKATLKSSLLITPAQITDAGVLPTPAVTALLGHSKYDCGIMITASHNAYADNGIKIIDSMQGKLSAADEQLMGNFFQQEITPTYDQFGTDQHGRDLENHYSDIICSFFAENFLEGIKIILDCANGATHAVAPAIFKRLGATVIAIHNQPNGFNINEQCGATNPDSLKQAVLLEQAAIGFAFDGDGDRVIAVNKNGHLLDGDDILALLSHHEKYKNNTAIVGTIMSNQALAQYLQEQQKTLIRANVGDKHVAQQLQVNNSSLGGEPSGHIICTDYAPGGDGIFAALRIVEALKQNDNWSMKTFEKFPHILVSVAIKIKKDLTKSPLADIIAASAQQLPHGRVLVRYSGTEPVLRIMVEDEDKARAEKVCLELQRVCIKELT